MEGRYWIGSMALIRFSFSNTLHIYHSCIVFWPMDPKIFFSNWRRNRVVWLSSFWDSQLIWCRNYRQGYTQFPIRLSSKAALFIFQIFYILHMYCNCLIKWLSRMRCHHFFRFLGAIHVCSIDPCHVFVVVLHCFGTCYHCVISSFISFPNDKFVQVTVSISQWQSL